jgi:2-oxoglutarate dehydrogenase E2 component (dihydrolipoamide succinyltransferase)
VDIRVVMPHLTGDTAEGEVVRWLKSVGDRVEHGEPLLEVEVGKASAEVASPVAGTLREIALEAGEKVASGALVAVLSGVEEVAALLTIPEAGARQVEAAAAEGVSAEHERAMAELVKALAQQMEEAGAEPAGPPAAEARLDPRLVGTWHRSEFYSSGGFSMSMHRFRVLGADGRFVEGGGSFADLQLLDSSGNWSGIDSLESVSSEDRGAWQADEGVLTLSWDDGSGAEFTFEVEPDALLLVSTSGDRTLWTRG